jgi:hypothetical protein
MRNYGLRALQLLACVILVVAAGACQAFAFFDSMTSMFTAVAVPQASHYQASGLTNSNFLKNTLNLVPQNGQTTGSQQNTGTSVQNLINLNLKPSEDTPSDLGLMNTMLTPGVNESSNPALSSYDSFLQKYTHGTGNIFKF